MAFISGRIFYCLLLILICYSSISAQQYPITHYTRDRGLSGNQVWGIYQDNKGYMWFCTSAGLIKYDGKAYRFFDKSDGLVDDLPLGITGDANGNLWVSFTGGVSEISGKGIKNWYLKESEGHYSIFKDSYNRIWVHSLFFPGDVMFISNDSLTNFSEIYNFKNQVIVNITEDRKGAVYFITRGGKLYRFFANSISEIIIDDLIGVRARYTFFDTHNNFILCTENGLGIIPAGTIENNPKIKWITKVVTNFGMQNKKGYYWFASEDGIFRLKNITDDPSKFVHIREENGLRSNIIYRIFQDYEGNLWIGHSENGISKLNSLMFCRYGKQEGLISDAVLSVSKVKDFFLVAADKGLFRFDGRKFEPVGPSSEFSKRWFFTILPYSDNEIYLGSTPGLVSLRGYNSYSITGLETKIIYTLMKDHRNNVWIGTNTGLFLKSGEDIAEQDFDVSQIEIKKLLEVNDQDLYVGTENGLVIIEGGTVPFAKRKIIKNDRTGLPLQPINDMIRDADGEIIIAIGKQLMVMNKDKSAEAVKGLNNIQINVLHADSNNRLWAGSNSTGLYVLQKINGHYEAASHYTYRDGISSDEFAYNNSVVETADGKIYFGTFGGLTVYNPAEIPAANTAPYAYITGVKINDSAYTVKMVSGTELGPSQNKISFKCVGLSFYNEDEVRFQYYISGIEKEWANISSSPEITYGYLEPGEYTFYMRAVNPFGTASQPQSISFTILAPVWKRPWFLSITILLILLTAYLGYRYRLSHIRRRNQQLEKIVLEKTQHLKESNTQLEVQNTRLIEAQKELVGKQELEKAHKEIQLLKDRLEKENIYLREKQGNNQELSSIVGRSPAMIEIRKKIIEIAETDTTVLITGETGVGKNLIAEAIHNSGLRKDRSLITVNCAAIPEALVESELFGYEKGAFTGAAKTHCGKFEVADGSTIFLDEIGDMNLTVQAKVLNVIQSRKFIRIGSSQEINTDVRIIAATNHNLAQRVSEGKFRQDLFYRLNVYPIHVPPLRECRQDIEPLAKYFADRYAKLLNKKIKSITKSALEILNGYAFPGNVRELENIIHRSVIITKTDVISDEDILLHLSASAGNGSNNYIQKDIVALEEMEKQYIIHVLNQVNGKISGDKGAAELLNINPSTLRSRMKKLGIIFSENN